LVTHLRRWTGNRNPLLAVGAGTGFGYLACNFPPLFTATPDTQALSAGILCLVGIGISLAPCSAPIEITEIRPLSAASFLPALASLTALVWLDSAAFFIIQNTPSLKTGTWQGALHLWANGLLHVAAALAGVWFLRRRGLAPVLAAAFLALGSACLLLLDPGRALLASVFYPVGVSLYSVVLVAYPSLIAPARSAAERGRMAGWLYALAGWSGSALGIGMGQHLGYVPAHPRIGAHGTGDACGSLSRPVSPRLRSTASTYPGGTGASSVHFRGLHPLPLSICAPEYSGRSHVGAC
jgi:cytochrome c oxidase cbb3-type subunit 2